MVLLPVQYAYDSPDNLTHTHNKTRFVLNVDAQSKAEPPHSSKECTFMFVSYKTYFPQIHPEMSAERAEMLVFFCQNMLETGNNI